MTCCAIRSEQTADCRDTRCRHFREQEFRCARMIPAFTAAANHVDMTVDKAWKHACAFEINFTAFDAFRRFNAFADAGNLFSGNQKILDSLIFRCIEMSIAQYREKWLVRHKVIILS